MKYTGVGVNVERESFRFGRNYSMAAVCGLLWKTGNSGHLHGAFSEGGNIINCNTSMDGTRLIGAVEKLREVEIVYILANCCTVMKSVFPEALAVVCEAGIAL